MRISDWSSDVCSSDLGERIPPLLQTPVAPGVVAAALLGAFEILVQRAAQHLAEVLADAGVVAEVLVAGGVAGPGVGALGLPDDLGSHVHHRDLVGAFRGHARPAAARTEERRDG